MALVVIVGLALGLGLVVSSFLDGAGAGSLTGPEPSGVVVHRIEPAAAFVVSREADGAWRVTGAWCCWRRTASRRG